MPLRLVFECADLQRVRIATAPDPLWELVSSLPFAHARNPRGDAIHEQLSLLHTLMTHDGDLPRFLTPPPVTTDIDASCEIILRAALARPSSDIATMRMVVTAVRQGYRFLVAPEWHRAQYAVTSDRAERASIVATHGVERLLLSLPDVLSWDGTVLVIRCARDRTIRLRGAGLTLLPSYFMAGGPVTLIDPELPPVLAYPARTATQPRPDVPHTLSRLITRTRAECLRVLLMPHSTSALAHRLGVSVGTACKQTTVLRDSGLISSIRDGAAVVHRTTSLGFALIAAAGRPGGQN